MPKFVKYKKTPVKDLTTNLVKGAASELMNEWQGAIKIPPEKVLGLIEGMRMNQGQANDFLQGAAHEGKIATAYNRDAVIKAIYNEQERRLKAEGLKRR
jgi:hypothetical protein